MALSDLDRAQRRDGFDRIGRIDAVGRRSLWIKFETHAIWLRAGREGKDAMVLIPSSNPLFDEIYELLTTARFAAEWESPLGDALEDT